MEFETNPYIVYVKTNDSGYITAVNSSAFLSDATGWIEIDLGYGDRYSLAQGNYFPQPIITKGGAYRYKLVDGKPVECTSEEIYRQEEAGRSEPAPTLEKRVDSLETDSQEMREALELILTGVTQ